MGVLTEATLSQCHHYILGVGLASGLFFQFTDPWTKRSHVDLMRKKMVEHHLEILGLKVDVAPGRYFGGGFERAACVVAEELRDVIGAPRHSW